VDWSAADGQPVRLVFLLAGREADGADAQADLISRLTQKILDGGFRERLLAAADPDAVVRHLQQSLDL
jgi:PTS system fructose-specific IIC component